MKDFHGEIIGTDESRRLPVAGLSTEELREAEISVLRERLDEVMGKPGQTGERMKRALALLRAQYRSDPEIGNKVRNEEPGIDDDFDILNNPMFDDLLGE